MVIRPVELIADAMEFFFDELFLFGYHARRISEITGVGKGEEISKENAFKHEGVVDAPVYKYDEILNYLMRARSISIGLSDWNGKKRWLNSKQDKIIAFVKVKTDWKESQVFYIFPLVNHFLLHVLPKATHPRELRSESH